MAEIKAKALALYKPPFRFVHGYIYDAENNMVADQHESCIARVRGWGRISYMGDAEKLQDTVGELIAEALTQYWGRAILAAIEKERLFVTYMEASQAIQGDEYATNKAAQPQLCLTIEDAIERAYWNMLARQNGEGEWKHAPMTGRDAFKWEVRGILNTFYSHQPEYAQPIPDVAAERWQPIETAPKDAGIWAYNGHDVQGVMKWIEGPDYALWAWADETLEDIDPTPVQPTHWMPLPTPPSLQPEAGKEGAG